MEVGVSGGGGGGGWGGRGITAITAPVAPPPMRRAWFPAATATIAVPLTAAIASSSGGLLIVPAVKEALMTEAPSEAHH